MPKRAPTCATTTRATSRRAPGAPRSPRAASGASRGSTRARCGARRGAPRDGTGTWYAHKKGPLEAYVELSLTGGLDSKKPTQAQTQAFVAATWPRLLSREVQRRWGGHVSVERVDGPRVYMRFQDLDVLRAAVADDAHFRDPAPALAHAVRDAHGQTWAWVGSRVVPVAFQ
jgi:hypothetical protein